MVRILIFIVVMTLPVLLYAQVDPPKPIAVYVSPSQGMNFGAFFHGTAGGTIIVDATGSRSTTGSVVQASMGIPFSPAIFEVEANQGTILNILNGPDVLLTGSNGGSLTLHLGGADIVTPYITSAIPPSRTTVRIGGTLTVGTAIANPPGSYSGSFFVTFIQE